MRSTFSVFILLCLFSIHLQPSHSHLPPFFKEKLLGKGSQGKDAGGTALAAVISSRKIGLGLKAILFKPLLLVALAKIKFALLLGKPLALLAIKKLLLKAVLGKLLLKIPLILLKGKALLFKMLALKIKLITKGLLGFKAPLTMLFLGACALGSGLGLAVALGATLHKLKEDSYEEDYSYEEPYYPPPRPSYGPPSPPAHSSSSYSPNPAYSPSYSSDPAYSPSYSPDPAYSAPAVSYSQSGRDTFSSNGYGNEVASLTVGIGETNFGTPAAGYSDYGNVANAFQGGYEGRRQKRDYSSLSWLIGADESNQNEGEEFEEEAIDESPEDLQLEFEAARTNGNAYLYMAAQFDEKSCGRRLLCEIYQKAHESLTEDEILLQEIFGYPLSALSEEDEGTPKEMYYRAAQLGTAYEGRPNNRVCARYYSACPHNADQLINIFVTEDVQTNEIDTTDHRPSAHLQPPQSSANLPFYHSQSPAVTVAQSLRQDFRTDQQSSTKTGQQQVSRPGRVFPALTSLRHRFLKETLPTA
ncbi:hypothetical protein DAPPUDRAFT_304809 [Daphnia pulex]|uniref:Uncharacterized protein n=1 Tax=Daphnia pulex TaxID=6669 RepID=E9FV11_DAPPU|nr:hypothetical protein DAPPUDRAFT_304809 [Daphnia pulex]|eukprot:EFX88816.1 hypothetical protein DAPPUDRAFT_304809 [Daphnia pulex]